MICSQVDRPYSPYFSFFCVEVSSLVPNNRKFVVITLVSGRDTTKPNLMFLSLWSCDHTGKYLHHFLFEVHFPYIQNINE